MSPLLAKVLHVRRTELRRTLQLAGFAIVVGQVFNHFPDALHLIERRLNFHPIVQVAAMMGDGPRE